MSSVLIGKCHIDILSTCKAFKPFHGWFPLRADKRPAGQIRLRITVTGLGSAAAPQTAIPATAATVPQALPWSAGGPPPAAAGAHVAPSYAPHFPSRMYRCFGVAACCLLLAKPEHGAQYRIALSCARRRRSWRRWWRCGCFACVPHSGHWWCSIPNHAIVSFPAASWWWRTTALPSCAFCC